VAGVHCAGGGSGSLSEKESADVAKHFKLVGPPCLNSCYYSSCPFLGGSVDVIQFMEEATQQGVGECLSNTHPLFFFLNCSQCDTV